MTFTSTYQALANDTSAALSTINASLAPLYAQPVAIIGTDITINDVLTSPKYYSARITSMSWSIEARHFVNCEGKSEFNLDILSTSNRSVSTGSDFVRQIPAQNANHTVSDSGTIPSANFENLGRYILNFIPSDVCDRSGAYTGINFVFIPI